MDEKIAYKQQPIQQIECPIQECVMMLNEEKFKYADYYQPEIVHSVNQKPEPNSQEKNITDLSWRRMIEKNPKVTVYKLPQKNLNKNPIQNENDPTDAQKNGESDLRNSITWLYNKQQVLECDGKSYTQNVKFLLKHILTYEQQKMGFSTQANYFGGEMFCQIIQNLGYDILEFINQFYNLYHYVQEAVEKQQEGIINNAFYIIQPQIYVNNINYFAQSVGAQIQASCKQSKDASVKPNKVVFVNLTGQESLINLELWTSLSGNEDSFYYYSFIKIEQQTDVMQHFNEFKKYYEQMQTDSKCKIQLIPFFCPNNTLTYYLFSVLFDDFLYKSIQKFQPSYIALSLSQSDNLTYEDQVLEKAIKELSQMCFNKLLLHCHFPDMNQNNFDSIKNEQMLNKCYSAFAKKKLSQITQQKISEEIAQNTIHKTIEIFEKLKLERYINHLRCRFPFLLNNIQIRKRLQENQTEQNFTTESPFNKIFYKKSNVTKIIIPILEANDQITCETEIKIFYQDQVILIYQNELSDQFPQYLYYKIIKSELKESNNVEIKIKFIKINLDSFYDYYSQAQLMNPIIFYIEQFIYILYGTYTQIEEQVLNTRLFRFDIKNNKWSTPGNQLHQLPQQMFSGKTYFDMVGFDHTTKFFSDKAKKLIDRVKAQRISPTVCFLKQNRINQRKYLVLFTGENQKEPEIMNYVEVVEITEGGDYCSGKVDKSQLFKNVSIKPFPNQIILEAKLNAVQVYLLLPGNDEMRKQKYNHPANSQFSSKVTIIKSSNELNITENNIQYIGDFYFNISSLSNKQFNQKLIYSQDHLLVWRVINVCTYKQYMKKKRNNIQYPTQQQVLAMKEYSQDAQQSTKELRDRLINNSYTMVASELDIMISYLEEYEGKKIESSSVKDFYMEMKEIQEENYDEATDSKEVEKTIEKIRSNKLPKLEEELYITENDTSMEEESNSEKGNSKYFQNTIKKDFIINDKEIYTVAFESYIFYNMITNEIKIKQFSYELCEPLILPRFDISSNNQLVPPYVDLTKSQQISTQFKDSQSMKQQSMQLEQNKKNYQT